MAWHKIGNALFGEDELGTLPLKALSLGLLLFALVCAWVPHQETRFLFWQVPVSFSPDFVSGALALAIITPLYARRIIPYPHHSVNGILFLVVNLALTATFIQITLGKGTSIGTMPGLIFITSAIILSWLGLRAAAGLAWLLLLAFSVVSVVVSDYAWGFAGFGFVVSGFCGLLLQTPFSPAELVAELAAEYQGRSRGSPADIPLPPSAHALITRGGVQ